MHYSPANKFYPDKTIQYAARPLSFMRGSARFCGKFRRFFPFPAFFAAALIANNLGSGSRANFGDHSLSLLITIVPIKGYQTDLRNPLPSLKPANIQRKLVIFAL